MEHEQWTALVKQLEDLLSIQCLLDSKPSQYGSLTKPPWDPEPMTLCLKQVLDGGRGELYITVSDYISYIELYNC
jgi:Rab3 GTPase-activating protein regulatory subunit C-terminus